MPDDLIPQPQGLLPSIANEISLPGYGVKNLLMGNFGGVANNIQDFLTNLIPMHPIAPVSTDQDRPTFAQAIGLDDMDPGFAKSAVNFVGDIATDPVSYIPGAAIAKGLGLAGKGAQAALDTVGKIPGLDQVPTKVNDFLDAAGQNIRSTFGAQRLTPEADAAKAQAIATGANVRTAGQANVAKLFENSTDEENVAVGHIMQNLQPAAGGALNAAGKPLRYVPIDPSETMNAAQRAQAYLRSHPDLDATRVSSLVDGTIQHGATQAEVATGSGVGGSVFAQNGLPKEYFPSQYSGLKEPVDMQPGDLLGSPSFQKEKTLLTGQDRADFLNANPEVNLEFNAAKALGLRSEQAGNAATKASLGKSLFEQAYAGKIDVPDSVKTALGITTPGAPTVAKAFVLSDDADRAAVRELIGAMDPEQAKVLGDVFNGLPKRGALPQLLASLNQKWKGFAVYGAFLPKLASMTRNLTGGLWQELSTAEARGNVGDSLVQAVPRWLQSVDDGIEKLTGSRIRESEFSDIQKAVDASGGDPNKMLAAIQNPTLRDAVRLGVLDNNQVSTELMIRQAQAQGWRKMFGNMKDYPGVMFQGTEQRMRYGLFKNLTAQGKTPEEAAKVVRDAFYDYHTSSALNRTARDFIPFFQFTAKAIPQAAKFFAEKPLAATTVAETMNQSNGQPIYPYMEGKSNIPVGPGPGGLPNYLTGFSLPYENLSFLPNPLANPHDIGRQVEQSIVGASQPLLKTIYSMVSGREPYFGNQYGAYDKVAGLPAGGFGQVANEILGSGLPYTQAVASPLQQIGNLTNDQISGPEQAANLLTGLKFASVDPNLALQQRIQDVVSRNPDIQKYVSFHADNPNAQTAQLLQELKDAKAKVKAERQAIPSAK